jgi:hypothetical protein
MAGREYRDEWVSGDRVRVPVDGPGPTGVDGQASSHAPGALPLSGPAVVQDWDGLRPALRDRLSSALGTILMWWREDDDPFDTRVVAFGERGMCLAEPATRAGREGHQLDVRLWAPGSVKAREFHGQALKPDAPALGKERTRRKDRPGLTLPPLVRALLGHLPPDAQQYLQVPLLTGGGVADGERWYQTWDGREQTMDAWLWLRAGRAVTFAQGRRVRRRGERGQPAHWDLRCWRATYA